MHRSSKWLIWWKHLQVLNKVEGKVCRTSAAMMQQWTASLVVAFQITHSHVIWEIYQPSKELCWQIHSSVSQSVVLGTSTHHSSCWTSRYQCCTASPLLRWTYQGAAIYIWLGNLWHARQPHSSHAKFKWDTWSPQSLRRGRTATGKLMPDDLPQWHRS